MMTILNHRTLFLFSLSSLFLFIILSYSLDSGTVSLVNEHIYTYGVLDSYFFNAFSSGVSSALHPTVLLIVSCVLSLIFLFRRKFFSAFFILISIFVTTFSALALKSFFALERPVGLIAESGHSFPSAHASVTASFVFTILYLFRHKIKDVFLERLLWIIFGLSLLSSGLARLFLGVHWASDVFGGIMLGFFCSSLVALILHFFGVKDKTY
jgi:undecaprenyl-diphosphatase